jgi:hypothetical protein
MRKQGSLIWAGAIGLFFSLLGIWISGNILKPIIYGIIIGCLMGLVSVLSIGNIMKNKLSTNSYILIYILAVIINPFLMLDIFDHLYNGSGIPSPSLTKIFALAITLVDFTIIVFGIKNSTKKQKLFLYIPLALLIFGAVFTFSFLFFGKIGVFVD